MISRVIASDEGEHRQRQDLVVEMWDVVDRSYDF